jgi:hypothetical protein
MQKLITSILMLILSGLYSGVGVALAAPPGTANNVTVVNTTSNPVPVTGDVNITNTAPIPVAGNVTINGIPSVNVTNTVPVIGTVGIGGTPTFNVTSPHTTILLNVCRDDTNTSEVFPLDTSSCSSIRVTFLRLLCLEPGFCKTVEIRDTSFFDPNVSVTLFSIEDTDSQVFYTPPPSIAVHLRGWGPQQAGGCVAVYCR